MVYYSHQYLNGRMGMMILLIEDGVGGGVQVGFLASIHFVLCATSVGKSGRRVEGQVCFQSLKRLDDKRAKTSQTAGCSVIVCVRNRYTGIKWDSSNLLLVVCTGRIDSEVRQLGYRAYTSELSTATSTRNSWFD